MTVPQPPRLDDEDPTGMRHVLHSLPDPGPMPADLVARITAALEAEQSARATPSTVVPLVPRPRRVWPRYAAAAAVAGLALTGGLTVLSVVRPGSFLQSLRDSVASTTDAGARPATEAAGRATDSAQNPGPVGGSDSLTTVSLSGSQYSNDQLATQAAALLARPREPLRELAAESPNIGPIGTPLGARDCATALGIDSSAQVIADLGVSAGAQVALILSVSADGHRTAYLVERDCRLGHPEIVAGPVALAS